MTDLITFHISKSEGKKPQRRGSSQNIWDRKRALNAHPLSSKVKPDQVLCKPCQKWIKLSGVTYIMQNWMQHCENVHSHSEKKAETVYISSDEEDGSSDYSSELSECTESSTSTRGSPIAVTKVESGMENGMSLKCSYFYLLIYMTPCRRVDQILSKWKRPSELEK